MRWRARLASTDIRGDELPDGGRRLYAADPIGGRSVVRRETGSGAALTRLRRIEGQVRGLQRLVDEDAYCTDVLTEISAWTRP